MFLVPRQPPLRLDETTAVATIVNAAEYLEEHVPALVGGIPKPLQRARPSRRADYVAGRYCAAMALRQSQSAVYEVGINPDRSPSWPSGYVGSITHCSNFAAAMVAPTSSYLALGLDAEALIAEAQCDEIADQILTPGEAQSTGAGAFSARQLITLLFSAKESIYKCLYPLVGVFFDFPDVRIEGLDADTGSFQFVLLKDLGRGYAAGFRHHGLYVDGGDLVHTAVGIRAPRLI